MATLQKSRQLEIENLVEKLLGERNLIYPGTSMLEISKALGADVYFGDLPEGEIEGVEGLIEWSGDGRVNIIINDSFSPERSTFTLAHELGHMYLHPNEKKNRVDVYNYSEAESLDETEANFFAATLLMPRKKFLEVWTETSDLQATANYFGVSYLAAKNRLLWLSTNTLQ